MIDHLTTWIATCFHCAKSSLDCPAFQYVQLAGRGFSTATGEIESRALSAEQTSCAGVDEIRVFWDSSSAVLSHEADVLAGCSIQIYSGCCVTWTPVISASARHDELYLLTQKIAVGDDGIELARFCLSFFRCDLMFPAIQRHCETGKC